jgi:hypothetical protein
LQALKVGSSVAMPRISSTSCITGTGFMKWNPMNFSGRSVRLARRVIEIDEVFEVRIVSGFRCGSRSSKIACLDRLPFGRGLDDQVRRPQIGQLQGGANPPHRLGFRVLGDLAAPDLPAEVPFDQRDRAVSASWLISVMMTS